MQQAELNPEQRLAVETTEGAVCVIAGPGAGKTRTLTSRYVYLVRDLGINPQNILCVTFTNKAAQEMKARIRAMTGDLDLGQICTFHAFCVRFLKDEGYVIGIVGDQPIDWKKQTVTFTVDKKDTKKVQVQYYNREGDGEVGTEIVEVEKDAIGVNTSLLKEIPEGYKLDTVGDITINYGIATVYVSRK